MESLLKVKDLTITFIDENTQTVVVDGVDFHVKPGEVLCIVGESGCGKSVTALSILGLLNPNARITSGSIVFNGQDLLEMNEKEIDQIRGSEATMVFQDVMNSLNPVLTIGSQLTEVIRIHMGYDKKRAREYAIEMIKK